jgi:guanine deaminase
MEAEETFALKGNVVYAASPKQLTVHTNSYLICHQNKVAGIFKELPKQWLDISVRDCHDQIIIPALTDLHIHAPQYAFRGMGMDLELLQWLEAYPFKEEARYDHMDYAKKAYDAFVNNLIKGATARVGVFATIHKNTAELLMELLAKAGLVAYVGKVNMDRNCPDSLREDTQKSLEETTQWIEKVNTAYDNVKPIITPRFVPSCTPALMQGLGQLAEEYQLPVQSHLSENRAEVAWVAQLHPKAKSYGHVYEQYGLFGQTPTIMAHCVYCSDIEMELMAKNHVYVAHCPQSNTNLASGIAPVRKLIKHGILVGLGTDVAGGFSTSVFRAMADAIQVSKLRYSLLGEADSILTVAEAFYLGTKGGGSFWGKAGSFEPGYDFDALVIDDESLGCRDYLTIEQRLERIIYLSDENNIKSKYVLGKCIF